MAVGDEAQQQNLTLVPDTGEDGKVKWGAREINRTRDFIARVMASLPLNRAGYREKTGIFSGTATPAASLGSDGDIYFKVIP